MTDILINYEIQGSSPEPYIVVLNFKPFTISCTCAAGKSGLPCRHRIGILNGENPGIIKGDISLLPKIKQITETTNLSEMFKSYEIVKNNKKAAKKAAENAFKKYVDARENFALKSVKTEKAVIKCREALEAAIDENIEAEKAVIEFLNELRTVFIFPF